MNEPTTTGPTLGFCQCGCGQRTNLAPFNHRKYGWIKGQPLRYLNGHNGVPRSPRLAGDDPNPSGLCLCGCGAHTTLATKGSKRSGTIKGKPHRFLPGHHVRSPRVAPGKPYPDEIRLNNLPADTIDEIVLSGVNFHLEQMDGDCYWIGLTRGKDMLHIDFGINSSGRLWLTVRDEGIGAAVVRDSQPATSAYVDVYVPPTEVAHAR